jgi:hypothetical protein
MKTQEKRKRGRPPGPSDERRFKRIRWLRRQGWSYGDIAARFRVRAQAIQAYCKRHGIGKGSEA